MTSDVPYHPLPIDQTDVRYLHGPDSSHQDGVPAGTVTELEWDDSPTYPGTTHRCWVHVPARYDATEPASLMVFLDGDSLVDPDEEIRATVVLDNLVHRGDLPVTIAVFAQAERRRVRRHRQGARRPGLT